MLDTTTPAKVICNTCKSAHKYRDPAAATKKKTTTRKTTTSRAKKSAIQNDSIWMEAMNNTARKSQPYSIKTKFETGDIIDHPKFGPGVVDKCIDANKVEVIFRYEVKTLMHNK